MPSPPVLLITTHGVILPNDVFKLPYNIVKLNAVAIGCSNYLNDSDADILAQIIIDERSHNATSSDLIETVQQFMTYFTKYNNINFSKDPNLMDKSEKEYMLFTSKHNNIQELNNGDEMREKGFAVCNNEFDSTITTPFYDSITLFDNGKTINILQEMYRTSPRINPNDIPNGTPDIGSKSMKQVQKEGLLLFINKNKDYGDAFAKYGPIGVLMRIEDKLKRSMSITQRGVNLVKDEGIRDTLIDLHNYAAMGIMLLDEEL